MSAGDLVPTGSRPLDRYQFMYIYRTSSTTGFNTLVPWRCSNSKSLNLFIVCKIAFSWMPEYPFGDKWILVELWTLVQFMTWCLQATSYYPSQCWPISMSPYGITRPQWVRMFVSSAISDLHDTWTQFPAEKVSRPWTHATNNFVLKKCHGKLTLSYL